MKRSKFKHGFSDDDWESAKTEAKEEMVRRIKAKRTISYSELVSIIKSVTMNAYDQRLSHFLGEIAEEEEMAGRGMLTVVVVHKNGDLMPGPGFFEMAKELGHDTRDREKFWIAEWQHVQDKWK